MTAPRPKTNATFSLPDFRALFESVPVAILVFLPDDPVFTIVAASDAYLRLTGARREDLLDRGVFECFPENPQTPEAGGVQAIRASFRRAIVTRGTDRIIQQYDTRPPSDSEPCQFEERHWSAVTTAFPRTGADVEYLVHCVEEITAAVRAEERPQKLFRQLTETSTFGFAIGSLDGHLSYINPQLLKLLGYSGSEFAAGLVRWDQFIPPEFALLDGKSRTLPAAPAQCAPYEKVYVARDGRSVPILITASLLEPVNGMHEVAAFVVDLTERKQSERDAFLVSLDDATRSLTHPEEIVETAIRLLCEQLRCERCVHCVFHADGETLTINQEYSRPGVVSMVGQYGLSMFGPDCAQAIRANLPAVECDIEDNPRAAASVPLFRQAGLRSFVAVPLYKGGRLISAIGLHKPVPYRWLPVEVELVQLVANRCWESIERAHVTRELQSSERRLRLAQKAGRIGSFEWLVKTGKLIWTPELEGLYQIPEGTFEGSLNHWRRLVVPEDADRVIAGFEDCMAKQQTERAFEFRVVLPDGVRRWLLGHAQFMYDEAGAPERMIGVNIDIDSQKQAETHLRRQWQAFDTALSHTPDFTYTFDLEGRFTYVNRPLLALWEKSLEQSLGKNFLELGYPPDLAVRLQRQVQQVIETCQPVRDQTPFAGHTGEIRQYEYIFVPVLGADGRVETVAGSTRDMTERNTTEQLVREDRRRWRDLLLQTPAAVAVLRGPDHVYEWVNDEYLKLVDRPVETLIGFPVREAVPEAVSQVYISLLDQVYRTGKPYADREALLWLGPGVLKEVYINFVYLPTKDSNGTIDGIFVHAVDITDLVTARKQVEESERQFRTLAETIPHMAFMGDETGSIFWYNRRWYDYTGSTPEDSEGWGWQSMHDPAVLPGVLAQWKHTIATGDPFEMVFPLRGADGGFRSFLTRVQPVRDKSGRVVRWFGTNTDITEQRKTEHELRRANRELEEFAFVSSHDLQEPLRTVKIYTKLIVSRVAADGGTGALSIEDAALKKYAGFVTDGVTRMEDLIRDLLTFSRVIHSEELATAGTVDLSECLGEALAVFRNRIGESGAVFTFSQLPVIRADSTQMSHVFQNLLSNALKYRRADVTPAIHVSAQADGELWIIAVKDNGIGFEQQYAERIFGLFKRLHKDEYPGTGLGLAICQRIVERHGGRIWADGRPGEGATFYFTVPRVENQSQK